MMQNIALHESFHDLAGAINGIHLMAEICTKTILIFGLQKLEGKFKKDISSNFKNIDSYHKKTFKQLELSCNMIARCGAVEIGNFLRDNVTGKLNEAKNILKNSEIHFKEVEISNTKDSLLRFAAELEKFQPVCYSMDEAIKIAKEKLAKINKY